MPEIDHAMIVSGWNAHAALRKTDRAGYQSALATFEREQPAVSQWLRESDQELFGGSVVLFEYGFLAWLIFRRTHSHVGTVPDGKIVQLCREEIALEEAMADESDFGKDRAIEAKFPALKQKYLRGFLFAHLFGEAANTPELVPLNSRVGAVRLGHCITALADVSE